MEKISKAIEVFVEKVLRPCVVVVYAVLILCLLIQVLCRYFLKISSPWTEEMGGFAFVWLLFLSAAAAFVPDQHIRITIFTKKLSDKAQLILDIFIKIFVIVFLIFLTYYGFKFCWFVSGQKGVAIQISQAFPVAAVPVGSFCMIFGILHSMYANIKAKKVLL